MHCGYRQCVTMFTSELPWLSGRDLAGDARRRQAGPSAGANGPRRPVKAQPGSASPTAGTSGRRAERPYRAVPALPVLRYGGPRWPDWGARPFP